jgi:hypothetical protein
MEQPVVFSLILNGLGLLVATWIAPRAAARAALRRANEEALSGQRRDAVMSAMTIVMRVLSSTKFSVQGSAGQGITGGAAPPTAEEVNVAYAKLMVHCHDREIPRSFMRFMAGDGNTKQDLVKQLFKQARAELGMSDVEFQPQEIAMFLWGPDKPGLPPKS